MITKLQWRDDAQVVFQFQIFYDLTAHIIRAEELVHKSLHKIRAIVQEPPPSVDQPPPGEEDIDNTYRYRYIAAFDHRENLLKAIRTEIDSLRLAHQGMSDYVTAWRLDTNLLEDGELRAWRLGDEKTKKKILRARFIAAMSKDKYMMNADNYEEKMKEIRTLGLEETVSEMETHLQILDDGIKKLEELVS